MTQGKIIAASQVIILLYDALELRDDCGDCNGADFGWVEIDGEAEYDPCECTINAVSILHHCKQSYTDAQILIEGLKT